MTIFVVI